MGFSGVRSGLVYKRFMLGYWFRQGRYIDNGS